MEWLLYLGGCSCLFVFGGVALFAILLLWGFLHRRGSQRTATTKIQEIELAEIPSLAAECVAVFDKELGIKLDLQDLENAAQSLDAALQDVDKLKGPFAKEDFYWHFVKPVGAFIGELMRIHAKHVWIKKPGRAPYMECSVSKPRFADDDFLVVDENLRPLEVGTSEVHPFEKVLSIASDFGAPDPGDVYAYLMAAKALSGG